MLTSLSMKVISVSKISTIVLQVLSTLHAEVFSTPGCIPSSGALFGDGGVPLCLRGRRRGHLATPLHFLGDVCCWCHEDLFHLCCVSSVGVSSDVLGGCPHLDGPLVLVSAENTHSTQTTH